MSFCTNHINVSLDPAGQCWRCNQEEAMLVKYFRLPKENEELNVENKKLKKTIEQLIEGIKKLKADIRNRLFDHKAR